MKNTTCRECHAVATTQTGMIDDVAIFECVKGHRTGTIYETKVENARLNSLKGFTPSLEKKSGKRAALKKSAVFDLAANEG